MPYFNPNQQNSYYSQPGMLGGGNPYGQNSYGGQPSPYGNRFGGNQTQRFGNYQNPYSMPQGAGAPQGSMPQYGNSSSYGANGENPYGGMLGGSGGGGTGGIFGDIANAFGDWQMSQGKYNNPADKAMPYLDQIPDTLKQYFDPYINAGKNAMGQLQGQYGSLINDPGALLNKFGQSFQQSPGYKFQVDQSLDAANRAAAAGGTLGTPMEQQNIAGTVNQLANQDYYNYLNPVMNLYGRGLSGLEGINNMGYGASTQLGEDLASNLQNKSQLAWQGQNGQNQFDQAQRGNKANMWGNIGSAVDTFNPFHWKF